MGKRKKMLPIGIENFEKLRTEGFYYIDKTGLIRELLDNWGEVNLFTRPGRFDKSLNMSMLRYFFECGCNSTIFDGLEIGREKSYCDAYMGKFPVISITLKGVSALNYEDAQNMLRSIIGNEAMRFQFLLKSEVLSTEEKELYRQMINIDTSNRRQSVECTFYHRLSDSARKAWCDDLSAGYSKPGNPSDFHGT